MIITYEDFQKLDLKIATIKSAEPIEGSEKLLKLRVEIGDEERQLVAEIATQYQPQKLERRQIVVLVNLEPKTLMGVESQGMLLAADSSGLPVLLTPERKVPSGVEIK